MTGDVDIEVSSFIYRIAQAETFKNLFHEGVIGPVRGEEESVLDSCPQNLDSGSCSGPRIAVRGRLQSGAGRNDEPR
jgi:hypothetical protein